MSLFICLASLKEPSTKTSTSIVDDNDETSESEQRVENQTEDLEASIEEIVDSSQNLAEDEDVKSASSVEVEEKETLVEKKGTKLHKSCLCLNISKMSKDKLFTSHNRV